MQLPEARECHFITDQGLTYMVFNRWQKETTMSHCFTTRLGGVSTGELESLNLGWNRGDLDERVIVNYERVGNVLDVNTNSMVVSKQVHETHIVEVTAKDKGNGIVYPNKWESVDGIYTSQKDITLVTHYADCVPLFFYAKEHGVIGMAHAGWKGTVNEIGRLMVEEWQKKYAIAPSDIEVGIGPSIGPCCFEVDEDVAEEFIKKFGKRDFIMKSTVAHKYHINLWECNTWILMNSGIHGNNICKANLCTCCHSELFFSHRKTKGKRGTLGAFMALK